MLSAVAEAIGHRAEYCPAVEMACAAVETKTGRSCGLAHLNVPRLKSDWKSRRKAAKVVRGTGRPASGQPVETAGPRGGWSMTWSNDVDIECTAWSLALV